MASDRAEPSRPEAALADLARISRHTVVWLNEAQFYLDDSERGERLAAALRNLLRDAQRAPVLVLATLWPKDWITLTSRDDPDRHAQARELLGESDIEVPAAFTGADLDVLARQAGQDSRLGEAAKHTRGGQITQYLAGVPVLMDRYRKAPSAARALIHAAMDARRLGCGPHLPRALLAATAPYYLNDTEWEQLDGPHWLAEALAYLTRPCNALPGILTPIKTPRRRASRAAQGARTEAGPLYQLADYLDQHGRRRRVDRLPPSEFWIAAACHALPADLGPLGRAAQARGLYRDAAQLWKNAVRYGDTRAAADLVEHVRILDNNSDGAAHWAATHAALANPDAVSDLLVNLQQAGAWEPIATLLARDPAGHAELDYAAHVAGLLAALHQLVAQDQVMKLADRAAADVALNHVNATGWLLSTLREVEANEQLTALADRAAADSPLDDMIAVVELLEVLRKVEADEQLAVLAERAVTYVSLDEPSEVARLLMGLREVGARKQIDALLKRDPATYAALDDPNAVENLLCALRNLELDEHVSLLARPRDLGPVGRHVSVLAARAAMDVSVDDIKAVRDLLSTLHHLGADEQIRLLLTRDPAVQASLDDTAAVTELLVRPQDMDPAAVVGLLQQLEQAGEGEEIALLARDPAGQVRLDGMSVLTGLLETLHIASEDEHVTRLASRAVELVAIDDPQAVATLLTSLREVRADDHIKTLLGRDPAAHAALSHPDAVACLLSSLDKVEAGEQVRALAARAVDAAVDDPEAVVKLMIELHHVQAPRQILGLADRAATHTSLDDSSAATVLLRALRELKAHRQVAVLNDRLCAAGYFRRSLQHDHEAAFTFGREADGSPAGSWTWRDLE